MRFAMTIGVLICCAGCGEVVSESSADFRSFSTKVVQAKTPENAQASGAGNEPSPAEGVETSHIVYTASVDLIVEDFDKFSVRLRESVGKIGGYIASSQNSSMRGEYQHGQWELRVPAAAYDSFMAMLKTMGSLESRSEDADDVSEEFVDLDARITSKERLESRLIALLEKSSDGIKDVIAVEQELARVRSEIERMRGRLRFLRDQISFSTITVTARQEREYAPVAAVPFATRVNNAWSDSVGGVLRFFGNAIVLSASYGLQLVIVLFGVGAVRFVISRRTAESS